MLNEKQTLTVNNKMELGENISDEAKGKGRQFVSRFIEPGVAHYQEFGDVLITKETFDKFINTMVGCPVIIQHKDIDDKNVDDERVGVVSKVWFNELDGWFYCEGIIWDKQAIDLVKNQDWNVSCTYDFDSDNQPKTHNGKKIDREFTGGEFLHLALVPNPRYERANIVMNSNVENDDEIVEWITVHGSHIPIKKGQSKDDAVKEYTQRIEQIKKNNEKYQKEKEYYNKKQEEKLVEFKKEYPIGTKFVEKYFGEDREHSIQSIKLDDVDKAIIITDENGKEHHALARDITLTKEKSNLEKNKNIERNKSLLKTDLTHMLKDIDRSADYRFEDSTQRLQVNDFGLWEKNEDGELQPTKETRQKVEQIKESFKKRFNLDLDSTWSEKKLYTFHIKDELTKEPKMSPTKKRLTREKYEEHQKNIDSMKEPENEGQAKAREVAKKIVKDTLKEVNNKGDITMTVLNELKDFIKNVVKNEKDEEMKEAKNEDKRKLIEEVGGILKGKVDDEIIKTIMKKMEEASYEPSEDDKTDNEADEEEKEEKFEEEKEVANKKAKNEEKETEEKEAEDKEVEKEEVKNKCKNSMNDVKSLIMGGSSKVKSNYITKEERFALGENY